MRISTRRATVPAKRPSSHSCLPICLLPPLPLPRLNPKKHLNLRSADVRARPRKRPKRLLHVLPSRLLLPKPLPRPRSLLCPRLPSLLLVPMMPTMRLHLMLSSSYVRKWQLLRLLPPSQSMSPRKSLSRHLRPRRLHPTQ